MRLREKLTVEEKVTLALELIKRERSLAEIREHYRVSHTTAYKVRKQFLDGGRRALSGEAGMDGDGSLEARVRALEAMVTTRAGRPRAGRRDKQGGAPA